MEICTCGNEMEDLGNISNSFYTTNPTQWDEVFICRKCKTKKTVRMTEEIVDIVPTDLDSYKNI